MKLEAINGNSTTAAAVVTPLKISSVLGQQPTPLQTTKLEEETDGQDPEDGSSYKEDEENDDESLTEEHGLMANYDKMDDIKLEEKIDMEADTAETEEETQSQGGGKKKAARKKRSLNWEEAERCLLVEVIKPKVEYVENRAVDAKSIKTKRMAWLQISKQFNSLNFRHRSLEQIQVQWRAMKNTAKKEYAQKTQKTSPMLEGLQMIEFMEEMQKEPIMGGTRSQTRNSAATQQTKKDLTDIDEEDDTPLAALPTTLSLSHSNSEDTQPSSTLVLASPPESATDMQQLLNIDVEEATTAIRIKKIHKKKDNGNSNSSAINKCLKTKITTSTTKLVAGEVGGGEGEKMHSKIGFKIKRQKCESLDDKLMTDISNNSSNGNYTMTNDYKSPSTTANINQSSSYCASTAPPPTSPPVNLDEKYKKQIFELLRRARLNELEYARKEHEQKLRFQQQEQELKLRMLNEKHEQQVRFALAEHDARMKIYTFGKKQDTANSNSHASHAAHAPPPPAPSLATSAFAAAAAHQM